MLSCGMGVELTFLVFFWWYVLPISISGGWMLQLNVVPFWDRAWLHRVSPNGHIGGTILVCIGGCERNGCIGSRQLHTAVAELCPPSARGVRVKLQHKKCSRTIRIIRVTFTNVNKGGSVDASEYFLSSWTFLINWILNMSNYWRYFTNWTLVVNPLLWLVSCYVAKCTHTYVYSKVIYILYFLIISHYVSFILLFENTFNFCLYLSRFISNLIMIYTYNPHTSLQWHTES